MQPLEAHGGTVLYEKRNEDEVELKWLTRCFDAGKDDLRAPYLEYTWAAWEVPRFPPPSVHGRAML